MMNIDKVARRYGKAIFGVFLEDDALEIFLKDLGLILQLFEEMPEVPRLLCNLHLSKERRKKMIESVLGKMNISQLSIRAILLMIEKKRHAYILSALMHAKNLALASLGISIINLTAASEADLCAIKGDVENKMASSLGGRIICETAVDPDIIGGFVLEYNDTVYDASVSGMIGEMKESVLT